MEYYTLICSVSCYRSQEVKPKETVVIQAVADLRITNVALGETLADASGRTTVKLVYQAAKASEDSDEEEGSDAEGESDAVATILCSLTPGKVKFRDFMVSKSYPLTLSLCRLNPQRLILFSTREKSTS